jgi:hypothetical protein
MMSKYAWSPGRINRSEKTCGCGLHRPRALELEEHRRLGNVHPERHVGQAVLLEHRTELLGGPPLEPDGRRDGALQAGVAADRVRLVVPLRELQPVRLRRGPEIPDPRRTRSRDQRVALALVERPVPDVGARGISDVAGLEQQDRAEIGRFELFANASEPVVAEASEVDAVLPVDPMQAR